MGGGGVYLNYLNIPGVQLFRNIKIKIQKQKQCDLNLGWLTLSAGKTLKALLSPMEDYFILGSKKGGLLEMGA